MNEKAFWRGFIKAAGSLLGPGDLNNISGVVAGKKPYSVTESMPQPALQGLLSTTKPIVSEYPNLTNAVAKIRSTKPGVSPEQAYKMVMPEFLKRTQALYSDSTTNMNFLGKKTFNILAPSLENLGKGMATSPTPPVAPDIASRLGIDFSKVTNPYNIPVGNVAMK